MSQKMKLLGMLMSVIILSVITLGLLRSKELPTEEISKAIEETQLGSGKLFDAYEAVMGFSINERSYSYEGHWTLVSDQVVVLDQEVIQAFIGRCLGLPYSRYLEEELLSEMGEDPKVILLETEDNSLQVMIGDSTIDGKNYYISVTDHKQVQAGTYIVSKEIVDDLLRMEKDFYVKEMILPDESVLDIVALEKADGSPVTINYHGNDGVAMSDYTLSGVVVAGASGDWKEVSYQAYQEALALLSSLNSYEVIVESDESNQGLLAEKKGKDNNAGMSLTVSAGGEERQISLYKGEGAVSYMKREGTDLYMSISTDIYDDLNNLDASSLVTPYLHIAYIDTLSGLNIDYEDQVYHYKIDEVNKAYERIGEDGSLAVGETTFKEMFQMLISLEGSGLAEDKHPLVDLSPMGSISYNYKDGSQKVISLFAYEDGFVMTDQRLVVQTSALERLIKKNEMMIQ